MRNSLRIAVADDEPEMRDFLQQAVTGMGHQVCGAAQTATELVDLCRAEQPDLTIVGDNLPGLKGTDAAGEIKSAPVPVILLVTSHDGELSDEIGSSNVLGCLVKPILQVDLIPAITLAMHRFRQLQSLKEETEELQRLSLRDSRRATDNGAS